MMQRARLVAVRASRRQAAAGAAGAKPASSPSATCCARLPSDGARRARPAGRRASRAIRSSRCRRTLRLSRDGADEPSGRAPSRRDRRARLRGRRAVGARPAAAARRGRDRARRRDRGRPRDVPALARAWAQAAAGRGRRSLRGRRLRPRDRGGDLAQARRADARAPRCWPSSGCARPGRAARPAPTRLRCSARPAAAKACWRWTRTTRWSSREGAPDGPEDRWFARLGDARRRHPARGRRALLQGRRDGEELRHGAARSRPGGTRIADWIGRSNPQDLLSVDIFFDLRGVHGDIALADDAVARRPSTPPRARPAFAKLLVETAGSVEPGLHAGSAASSTEQGRIDLKKAGLFGIVSAARALAICHHVVERSTPARLDGHQGARHRRRRGSRRARWRRRARSST